MIHLTPRPILYVDDTEEQRYAMRRILETGGYRVLEAGTGEEALEMVKERPCLVVLDVRLPDLSGYEVCRRIKQEYPNMPVLQVSASFSDPLLRASGLSGGADAYIAQPVHPAEMLSLTRALIRMAEADSKIHFLAEVGPRISATLVFPQVVYGIRDALVPRFADECVIFLRDVPDQVEPFWSDEVSDASLKSALLDASNRSDAVLADNATLIAPISADQSGFGAISFRMTGPRRYTDADCSLANDIAHRAGLAVRNAILFSQEQSTREALVKAEKLVAAGRLSAAIAHELNNPLEAVTNLIYLIHNSGSATEEIKGYAATALSELGRVAHIARQTLGFYRELSNPAEFDLSENIRSTIHLYAQRIGSKNVSLLMELDDTIQIHAIKGEIRQVISNLLVNAVDAVNDGGSIKVRSRAENGVAIVDVSDTGNGIPASVLPKIFEPFFTTKTETGTGLGLWVSENIIRKHGGKIIAKSPSPLKGFATTFEFTLPLSQ